MKDARVEVGREMYGLLHHRRLDGRGRRQRAAAGAPRSRSDYRATPPRPAKRAADERRASDALLDALPARRGHFRLESGLHTDCWLTLDALFVDPKRAAPLVDALAEQLRGHAPSAVCGPLLGGAFLAQAIAQRLGVRFYYAEPRAATDDDDAERPLSRALRASAAQARVVAGERVAVVDDAVSAGSSVRATADALAEAGATVVVVGTLLLLGDVGARALRRTRASRSRRSIAVRSRCGSRPSVRSAVAAHRWIDVA